MEQFYYVIQDQQIFEAVGSEKGSFSSPIDLEIVGDLYTGLDIGDVMDFLEDGEALKLLGIEDQLAVEDMHSRLAAKANFWN